MVGRVTVPSSFVDKRFSFSGLLGVATAVDGSFAGVTTFEKGFREAMGS